MHIHIAPQGGFMAVKVTKGNQANSVAQHGNGTGIEVREGHLLVTPEGSSKPVAIYAPGTWVSAEVTK
jgi:hypothetical protein